MEKKRNFIIVLMLLVGYGANALSNNVNAEANKELITFASDDGITVTADLYLLDKENAPLIILFHQARYSRGEYIETAKEFNKLGYSCLAVDQRSGKEVNGVTNLTNKEAASRSLPTNYADALPDMRAAVKYVKENYKPEELIIIGSSYSASLSIVLATEFVGITGVLAFSPGEYFKLEGKTFKEYARKVKCPIFITSAKSELPAWATIYEYLPEIFAYKYEPEVKGIHGSRALWKTTTGNEDYWQAVKEFLDNI